MKYIFIAALFISGCVNASKVDDFKDFDKMDLAESDSNTKDEFDEFDEMNDVSAKPVPIAENDTLEEINNVEADIKVEAPREINANNIKRSSAFYTVQVGAYPTKKLAKKNAAKMGVDRSIVSYQEADVNGKTWQRVYIGKFKSRRSALQFQKKLLGDSIIRNIQSQDASLWH